MIRGLCFLLPLAWATAVSASPCNSAHGCHHHHSARHREGHRGGRREGHREDVLSLRERGARHKAHREDMSNMRQKSWSDDDDDGERADSQHEDRQREDTQGKENNFAEGLQVKVTRSEKQIGILKTKVVTLEKVVGIHALDHRAVLLHDGTQSGKHRDHSRMKPLHHRAQPMTESVFFLDLGHTTNVHSGSHSYRASQYEYYDQPSHHGVSRNTAARANGYEQHWHDQASHPRHGHHHGNAAHPAFDPNRANRKHPHPNVLLERERGPSEQTTAEDSGGMRESDSGGKHESDDSDDNKPGLGDGSGHIRDRVLALEEEAADLGFRVGNLEDEIRGHGKTVVQATANPGFLKARITSIVDIVSDLQARVHELEVDVIGI